MDISKLCQIRVENGQANLYTADGAMLPNQIDLSFEQPLEMARNKKRMAIATVKLYCTIADSTNPTE